MHSVKLDFSFAWLKTNTFSSDISLEMIHILDKKFEPYISSNDIQSCNNTLAKKIDKDYQAKNPLMLGILNGSFMFMADLVKKMSIDPEMSFIKLASYEGTSSTGKVNELIGLNEDIEGRHVIIVEDIVDTGNTLEKIIRLLQEKSAASVEIVSLLYKPDAYKKDYHVKYVGMEIPNKFVVGYGLDYNGKGRSLEDIYQLA